MGKSIRFALLALCFLETTRAGHLEPIADGAIAPKPKHPAFAQVEDTPGLPRVLLIGDSISIGYTEPVRKLLQGVANVHRAPENCGPTKRGLARLEDWLGDVRWDLIHFNFGLHDMKYLDAKGHYVSPEQGTQVATIEVYSRQLRKLVQRLKATGAKVVFATTTPVPEGAKGRVHGEERAYNDAALAIMRSENIAVNDLHTEITLRIADQPEGEIQEPRNVHFTPLGYQMLAESTAEAIRKKL